MTPDTDPDTIDKSERELMLEALTLIRPILGGRPCLLAVGFDIPGATKVASVSNLCPHDQKEMLEILIEGLTQTPPNTTLN